MVASAITDKGVTTANDATFAVMADNISSINQLDTSDATAAAGQILTGYSAYVKGSKINGSMTNQGAVSKSITPSTSSQSYTIPAGYHNGSGKVTVAAAPTSLIDGDAVIGDVLSGKKFFVDSYTVKTGTMVNQGAKTSSFNCGGSYTIPAGYHNGSGKITANSLASQTSATATAADIASGKTAWVDGSKITGTGMAIKHGVFTIASMPAYAQTIADLKNATNFIVRAKDLNSLDYASSNSTGVYMIFGNLNSSSYLDMLYTYKGSLKWDTIYPISDTSVVDYQRFDPSTGTINLNMTNSSSYYSLGFTFASITYEYFVFA